MGGMLQVGADEGGMEMKKAQRGVSLGLSWRTWRRMRTRTSIRKRTGKRTRNRTRKREMTRACQRRVTRKTSMRTSTLAAPIPPPHTQVQTRSADARRYAASTWACVAQSWACRAYKVCKVCRLQQVGGVSVEQLGRDGHGADPDSPAQRADGASIQHSRARGSDGAQVRPHMRVGAPWMLCMDVGAMCDKSVGCITDIGNKV
ncbi:hypothetical protein JB92DRAFT_3043930 [Gautieria morchelliformis]|nr:hypothetical protein JB92DRAFT_3043930 [Gautieria morchelliformis]